MTETLRENQVSAAVGLESALCGLCREVLDKPFPEFSTDSPATTLKSLRIRAANGCHLCYLFLSCPPVAQISDEADRIVYTKSLPYNLNWGGASIRIQAIDEADIARGIYEDFLYISIQLLIFDRGTFCFTR